MKRRTRRPDQSKPLSLLEVLILATAGQDAALAAEDGKRRAGLRFFLQCYEKERPEVVSLLREVVLSLPGPPNPFLDLSPAVEGWLCERHLPVAAETVWFSLGLFGDQPLALDQAAAEFRQQFFLPFCFYGDGWKPGAETPYDAVKRIKVAFSRALRDELAAWKRTRAAVAAKASLSEVDRAGLRLLALRQAHGRTYQQLAEGLRPLRQALEDSADGGKQQKVTVGAEEAARKVKNAARLIGVAIRNAPTGRPPKTPK